MSHLQMLKQIFKDQSKAGVKSGDWDKLDFEIEHEGNETTLLVRSQCVGFVFGRRGRLKGIFNWKD